MNKAMLIRLLIVALLIVFYVIVAALDLSREIFAPIIVLGVAAVIFFPFGLKKKQPSAKKD
ncbi:hypothetical protein [Corynebacterium crudilactis]|uniref:Uncharacterized protein n=1 Tax=Corynebacterium crudilactis TaxID=1652495 RepID=A0A172QUQ4_9CORY|nr:hypothetical protein [Corynebacterium crudilactis]ANE04422.1 hypothetical protein ccrud_09565 [Corynebacterium crudilactis]